MNDRDRLYSAMTAAAEKVENTLANLLPHGDGPESRVFDAMRYAVLGGGKRLRPFLVMSSARLFDVDERCALRAGAAVVLTLAGLLVLARRRLTEGDRR